MDAESEEDRETVMMWCVQDEVNQEDSEQNEVDGIKQEDNTRAKVMHNNERSVICNEVYVYGWFREWLTGKSVVLSDQS